MIAAIEDLETALGQDEVIQPIVSSASKHWSIRSFCGCVALALLVGTSLGCSALFSSKTTDQAVAQFNPEAKGPTVFELKADEKRSTRGMVVSSSREASEIGAAVLESGGNAIDAAFAAGIALGVAEPSESGLGGITYMLVRLADGRQIAIDGSGPVPMKVKPERIRELAKNNQPYGVELSTVPGTLAALDHARDRYGTRSLRELLAPAIELADRGYRITEFGQTALTSYYNDVMQSEHLKHIVLIGGSRIPTKRHVIKRPLLAATLRQISAGGAQEFYKGVIAKRISKDMKARGGFLRAADLALLRARELQPARGSYRGKEIVSFPSPGSGDGLIHALNIIERLPSETVTDLSANRVEMLAKTFEVVLDDHHHYFMQAHERALTPTYPSLPLASKRASAVLGGVEVREAGRTLAPWNVGDSAETTQISIIDRHGNVVSLTQTLGRLYGSKTACPGLGFPYNNLLEGAPSISPTFINPTYMAPSIVVDDGKPYLVLGSAGSSRIPGILAGVISGVVDRGLGLREAIEEGRIVYGVERPGLHLEIMPPNTMAQVEQLKQRGYEEIFLARLPTPMGRLSRFGAVNAIQFDAQTGTMIGVGDPRRHGSAVGVREDAD